MEARHYEKLPGGEAQCRLCPHECLIRPGRAGRCRARVNRGGVLEADTYGRVSSASMDPIEKKPLYHFHPGERIFSIGSMGCNLSCSFCQNWQISHGEVPLDDLSPAQAVREARAAGSRGIAYTYNEPMIWFEYVMDTGRAAREAGLYNVLVTNGFVNEAPLEELLSVTDAMNIDLKSFDDSFYRELCGASVEPVKRVIVRAARGCHVEITTLVIPNRNDAMPRLEEEAKWISSEVGRGTPVHLSAYFPRYKLDEPPTSEETLLKAREVFCRYLDYVYLGNVAAAGGSDTACAGCGRAVVRRTGYRVSASGMSPDGSCAACGASCGIVTGARPGGAGDVN